MIDCSLGAHMVLLGKRARSVYDGIRSASYGLYGSAHSLVRETSIARVAIRKRRASLTAKSGHVHVSREAHSPTCRMFDGDGSSHRLKTMSHEG